MRYYDLINEKDGVDYGEGKDMVRSTNAISKECQCCNFYYSTSLYVALNITNTSAMGAFFVQYRKRAANEY